MVRSLLWVGSSWLFGAALILGSLMTLGSVLLWLVPPPAEAQPSTPAPPLVHRALASKRLRLLGFSLSLAIAGGIGFFGIPFPG